MCRIHNTLTTICFFLSTNFRNNFFIVREKQHIAPLFDGGGTSVSGFIAELEFIAIVCACFIRALKLADNAVSCNDHVDALVNDRCQRVKQICKLFADHRKAFTIAKTFNTVLLAASTNILLAKTFCPVCRIKHKRFTHCRIGDNGRHHAEHIRPRLRFIKAPDIEHLRAFLCVDEKRVGELTCKSSLTDTLRAV